MKLVSLIFSVFTLLETTGAQTYFYEALPGQAKDLGIGLNGEVWIIGKGGGVYHWNGSAFEREPGVGGANITVDVEGRPWLVSGSGAVYRREETGWKKLPGRGSDLAAGMDGSVWMVGWISTDCGWNSGYCDTGRLYRWNGSNWDFIDAGAKRISAGPAGVLWIVDMDGKISRLEGSTRTMLPGRGSDIACGADGSPWLVASGHVYRWGGANWVKTIAQASRIAVAPDGQVWLAASGGDIYRLHELFMPRILSSQRGNTAREFEIAVSTQPGVIYSLLRASDWSATTWVEAGTLKGTGAAEILRDTNVVGDIRFYRVAAKAP